MNRLNAEEINLSLCFSWLRSLHYSNRYLLGLWRCFSRLFPSYKIGKALPL